jgi:hypothetical protein
VRSRCSEFSDCFRVRSSEEEETTFGRSSRDRISDTHSRMRRPELERDTELRDRDRDCTDCTLRRECCREECSEGTTLTRRCYECVRSRCSECISDCFRLRSSEEERSRDRVSDTRPRMRRPRDN